MRYSLKKNYSCMALCLLLTSNCDRTEIPTKPRILLIVALRMPIYTATRLLSPYLDMGGGQPCSTLLNRMGWNSDKGTKEL